MIIYSNQLLLLLFCNRWNPRSKRLLKHGFQPATKISHNDKQHMCCVASEAAATKMKVKTELEEKESYEMELCFCLTEL